jgi:hypothetical protein
MIGTGDGTVKTNGGPRTDQTITHDAARSFAVE